MEEETEVECEEASRRQYVEVSEVGDQGGAGPEAAGRGWVLCRHQGLDVGYPG